MSPLTHRAARALARSRGLVALGTPTLCRNFNTASRAVPSVAPRLARALGTVPRTSVFAPLDSFERRHVGPTPHAVETMLASLGFADMDAFVADAVPSSIRIASSVVSEDGPNGIRALSESELLRRAAELGSKNKVYRTFIGTGYHQAVRHRWPPTLLTLAGRSARHPAQSARESCVVHPVQSLPSGDCAGYVEWPAEDRTDRLPGRLESLINFQTLTTSLTGLDIANASLLDEGTAAAEAMVMAFNHLRGARKTFFVDRNVLPQTLAVVSTRAAPFGIKVVVGNVAELVAEGGEVEGQKELIGVLLQYPDLEGNVHDWQAVADRTHALGGLVTCATDFLALTVLKSPGEWGADMAFGNSARFGVPLGFGGPHAAFFACTDVLKRRMPGRLVGLSKDAEGRPAYRLALQTREQHIRRATATSNVRHASTTGRADPCAGVHCPSAPRERGCDVRRVPRPPGAPTDRREGPRPRARRASRR